MSREDATQNMHMWLLNSGPLEYYERMNADELRAHFEDEFKLVHVWGPTLYLTPDGFELSEVDWDDIYETIHESDEPSEEEGEE